MRPTLSPVPRAPDPARAMRLPGGQTHPVWSSGVAATVVTGKVLPPSTDFETTRPEGIWWVASYTTPPVGLEPLVAIHCRSSTGTPAKGLAVHVAPWLVDDEMVELPSQRSVR